MIRVQWNYNGNTDRVLVLLPPLPTATLPFIHRQADIAKNYRKTLNNLCSKEDLKYIVVYVPNFDPTNYDQRCMFEDFYGKELRLIPNLEKLLDRFFPDYLTSECIYMLKNSNEWENSITPIEWYFDVVICEQLYEYYDSTSRWLRKELPKFMEYTVGASQIYESFLVKLVLMGGERTSGDKDKDKDKDTDTDTASSDKDLVFIFGDVESYEKELYIEIILRLIADCRVSAIFSFGNLTPMLKDVHKRQSKVSKIPRFELYTQPDISPELYSSMMDKLVKYSPSYTYFMWLGTFRLEEDETKYKHITKQLYKRAFVYSPTAWCSFFPDKTYKDDDGVTMTFEPCGMLDFYTTEGS